MTSDETATKIARQALAENSNNPALANGVNKLAEQFALRHARRALRQQLRPFAPTEEAPERPTYPLARATFFHVAASSPSSPAPLPARRSLHTPITKEQRRQHAQEFFALIFRDANSSLEDFSAARTRVFFRLVRELARHTRHVHESDALSALSLEDWKKPLRAQIVTGRFSRTSEFLRSSPEIALLPPPAPQDLEGYDPDQDLQLVHYCAALAALAEDLKIHDGTSVEPYLGRYGLKGLLEPALVRLACPSPEEVLEWEEQLVQDTLLVVLRRGSAGAYKWLQATHGMQEREAQVLVKAANVKAAKQTEGDIEEKRALAQLRLEDLYRRACKAMNLPAQLGAMKLQAIVAGLARVEPEDAMQEFVSTVKRVATEEPRQLENDDELDPNEP